MTPKQRVEAALKGQPVDKVPFTCYHFLMFTGEVERQLRNRGLCYIIYRGIQIFKVELGSIASKNLKYNSAITGLEGKFSRFNIDKEKNGYLRIRGKNSKGGPY